MFKLGKVIAEAVFKYAGSVYKDLEKMKDNSNDAKMFGKYVKYWGELKGFALALKRKTDRSSVANRLTSLMGYGYGCQTLHR